MKTSTELATGPLIMNSSISPGSLPWGITQQGGGGKEHEILHTSGRVTLGTMTVFMALGALRSGWLVSP